MKNQEHKEHKRVFSNTELDPSYSKHARDWVTFKGKAKKIKARAYIRGINTQLIRNGIGNNSTRLKNALAWRGRLSDLRAETDLIIKEWSDKKIADNDKLKNIKNLKNN